MSLEEPSQFSDTSDEECPLCTDAIKCKTTAVMEHYHGTPEFVQRRADLGFWAKMGEYLSLKERADLADRYERVWNARRAREKGFPNSLSPVRDAIHAGGVHLHYKGGTYRPLLIAKNSDDHVQERVTYVSLTNGSMWDRVLTEWADVVPWPDGILRRRYVPQSFVSLDERTRLEVHWAEQARRAAEAAKIEAAKGGFTPRTEVSRPEVRGPIWGNIEDDGPGAVEEAEKEIDFWKRMLIRRFCGCLALDCVKHGAYVSDDVDRVFALEEIAAIAERRKGS